MSRSHRFVSAQHNTCDLFNVSMWINYECVMLIMSHSDVCHLGAHAHLQTVLMSHLSAGLVRTALPDMDRELRDHYLLVIQAKDMIGQMGGLSGTTTVTVMLTDVNDNPPRFPRSESHLRASC